MRGKRWILAPMVVALVAGAAASAHLLRPRASLRPPLSEAPLIDQRSASLLSRSPVTGKPVDNAEELVAALPAELRRHFTFVYRSRSPAGGLGDRREATVDALHPRVILYSGDGRLVVALQSNPAKSGYDIAEFLRFSDEGARFELSRFVLPAAVRRDPQWAELATHNGEINPPECLRCHGPDVRPLLDSYPLWPGFYGGASDSFQTGSRELADYREFLSQKRNQGIFQQLEWPTGTQVPPYIDPDRYDVEANVASEEDLARSPNSLLGMALTELNRKRIERKLAASPSYRKYRRGLLAVLLGCQAPPMERSDVKPVAIALDEDNTARIERLGFVPKGPGGTYLGIREALYPTNVALILYVANALGVSPRDFSMSLEDGALGLYDGILSGMLGDRSYYLKEDLLLEMMRRLGREEPEFAPYVVPYHASSPSFAFGEKLNLPTALSGCGLLAQRQHESGVSLPPLMRSLVMRPPSPRRVAEGAEVPACAAPGGPVARCITCHEGEEAYFIGRAIPFSDARQLAPLLAEPSASTVGGSAEAGSRRSLFEEIVARMEDSGPARMPPHGARPTPSEIAEMRRYLEEVRAH